MTFGTECLIGPVRRACSREWVKSSVSYLWDVYSSPKPVGRHLWTQMCLCLTLAAATGALLHRWLSETLRYDGDASVSAALAYSVGASLASFLCHPLRCVLTLTLPTLCTKQGRKLLISASVMILIANVIPNIGANVGAVARTLKCTAESFSQTLLNSSELLNAARRDILREAVKARKEDLSIVTNLRRLETYTRVDVSEVKSRFTELIGHVDVNVSLMRTTLAQYKMLSNRILAAVFVALLIFESARYLKSYLTHVQFDNGSVDNKREDHGVRQRSTSLLRKVRILRGACTPGAVSLVAVTLYFTAAASIAALDYLVYHIIQVVLPWLLDFPPISATVSVSFKAQWFMPAYCIFSPSCINPQQSDFRKDYRWNFSSVRSLCDAATSAPDAAVSALLACLWLTSYALLVLEVYAARLRGNICASFFKKQEERRRAYRVSKGRATGDPKEPQRVVCT
ncbi:osteoclast stimulatory transmembrane protein isoform X1 [Syngnathoides biaculeatus]|uniref:osteoclast stimulatory transmembrane protein isoform X1 n=1 Tax=Syngnathoides biaculeatus TaxID=300417 RepID=UPI002ADE263D|nr:osteoclast stimulatory transmembrane protein isoform X1 [Syngnathoides biaculeatus]